MKLLKTFLTLSFLFSLGSALPTTRSTPPLSLTSISNQLSSILSLSNHPSAFSSNLAAASNASSPSSLEFPLTCQSECKSLVQVVDACKAKDRTGCLEVCSAEGWKEFGSCVNCDLQNEKITSDGYNQLKSAINVLFLLCSSEDYNVTYLDMIPYTSLTGLYSTLSIPSASSSAPLATSLAPSSSLVVATGSSSISSGPSASSAIASATSAAVAGVASPSSIISGSERSFGVPGLGLLSATVAMIAFLL